MHAPPASHFLYAKLDSNAILIRRKKNIYFFFYKTTILKLFFSTEFFRFCFSTFYSA